MVMCQTDREDLAIRLKAELKEFQTREIAYAEKRKELRDTELMFRKEQDKQLKKSGTFKEKHKIN
jgi:hypothetical protein